jgi:hypothetical protein
LPALQLVYEAIKKKGGVFEEYDARMTARQSLFRVTHDRDRHVPKQEPQVGNAIRFWNSAWRAPSKNGVGVVKVEYCAIQAGAVGAQQQVQIVFPIAGRLNDNDVEHADRVSQKCNVRLYLDRFTLNSFDFEQQNVPA